MVRLELIDVLLHHLDVLLVARDARTLSPIVLNLFSYKFNGDLVVFGGLRQSERTHHEEHLVIRVHFFVLRLQGNKLAQVDCVLLELKGSTIAAEQILGEELVHDDYSEDTVRVVEPVVVLALR